MASRKAILAVCALLWLPAAIQAGEEAEAEKGGHDSDCSSGDDNCIETGCCKNSSLTCYAKTADYGRCLPSCTPGIHEDEPKDIQEWWLCATAERFGCSTEGENCKDTACCLNPSMKCYKKNHKYSACRTECEPGVHDDDGEEDRTPWDCSEVTQDCAEVFQQCGGKGWKGTTCCKSGCSCQRTSAYYHQCARDDGGESGDPSTCSGEPPATTEAPEKKERKEKDAALEEEQGAALAKKTKKSKQHVADSSKKSKKSKDSDKPKKKHAKSKKDKSSKDDEEHEAKKAKESMKAAKHEVAKTEDEDEYYDDGDSFYDDDEDVEVVDDSNEFDGDGEDDEDDEDEDEEDEDEEDEDEEDEDEEDEAEEDEDDNDDDEWDDDVDYAEQLPKGAVVAPAARRGGAWLWALAGACGSALLAAAAALLSWQSRRHSPLRPDPVMVEQPLDTATE